MTDNSDLEAKFVAKLKRVYGDSVGEVPVRTKDFLKFFYRLEPQWSLISFRPDCSAFYAVERQFSEMVVFDERFGRSPWPCVFIRKGSGAPFLHYVDIEPDVSFFPEGLKLAASADFSKLASLDATKFNHGVYKNSEAVLQCGRGDESRQVVKTPESLYRKFDSVFHFDFDPCPLQASQDAMKTAWGLMNYVNPPFQHTGAFAWRAAELAASQGCRTVVICPALVQAKWRTQLTTTGHINAVIFLRSGIKFDGYDKKMPLPLNLLLIGPANEACKRKVPVFFWDPVGPDMRRKIPSLNDDSPLKLHTVPGWSDLT